MKPSQLIKKNPFILAPMDDVTDIAYRELCEEMGCSYSTTELTSVDALVRDKVYPARYCRGNLQFNSVQLFGSKPEVFVEAAQKVGDEADTIDVNFGCPSACVNANDAGAMLLKDPKNVGEIVEKLVKHVDKPITAKIRLGYKKTTYMDVAKKVEDAGADVLAVHGRTAEQKYTGRANWDAIQEIYSKIQTPLIGNGDISKEEDIDSYLGSHADALMVGRAAIGNPYLFKRFKHYFDTGKILEVEDQKELQKKLFQEYLSKFEDYEIRKSNQRIMRQAMWFFKGIPGVKELRKDIMQIKSSKEAIEYVKKF